MHTFETLLLLCNKVAQWHICTGLAALMISLNEADVTKPSEGHPVVHSHRQGLHSSPQALRHVAAMSNHRNPIPTPTSCHLGVRHAAVAPCTSLDLHAHTVYIRYGASGQAPQVLQLLLRRVWLLLKCVACLLSA